MGDHVSEMRGHAGFPPQYQERGMEREGMGDQRNSHPEHDDKQASCMHKTPFLIQKKTDLISPGMIAFLYRVVLLN